MINSIQYVNGPEKDKESYPVKILSSFLTNIFNLYLGTPGKLKVLLLGPTGKATLNTDGTKSS